MERFYGHQQEPAYATYFAGKKPGTPEQGYSMRSLDENEFILRFMTMLQDQRMSREEHEWW